MATTRTTVYLDAADYRRLKAAADRQGRSAAQLVREAVSEYARKLDAGRERPRSIGAARSGRPDFAERAEEMLRGFGDEGAPDPELQPDPRECDG